MHYTQEMKTRPTSIRLTEKQIEDAKKIAERQGKPYQTWIREVVSKAIAGESNRSEDESNTTEEVKQMSFKQVIISAANAKGINPYVDAFKPKDLGINASKYGSFSDHCISGSTKSSIYSENQCLEPVEFSSSGRPLRYRLV